MTPQPGQQTIAIHILFNILRSKGGQVTKFCQLIKYNKRSIFLENHTQNVVKKLSPDPLLKNENWAYLLINYLKFFTDCFYHMPSWGYQNTLRLSSKPLAISSYKAFLKNKQRSGICLPVSISAWFLKKKFLLLYSITWSNFIVCLSLPREILRNMCAVIVC